MINVVRIKRSSTASIVPAASALEAPGVLAVNLADSRLYTKNISDDIIDLTGIRESDLPSWIKQPSLSAAVLQAADVPDLAQSKIINLSTDLASLSGAISSTANRNLSAGDGLTGGGNLTADRSFAVDATVIRTTGDQTKTGSLTVQRSSGNVFKVDSTSDPQIAFDLGGTSITTPYRIFSWGSSKTLSLESMGDVNVVLDHNNNQTGKAFRVRHDGEGNAGTAIFTVNDTGNISWTGTATGNGSGLTTLNGSNISSGTVADARIATTLVRTSRNVATGDGLSGGGNLTADRTLTVDATVVRTTGNQTIAGVKTFSSNSIFNGNVGINNASPSERLDITGNAKISGHLSAATKSFLISNPKTGGQLQYGVAESNEHGVFVRGKTRNPVIELPDHWEWLVNKKSITVQLTPIKKFQPLFVESADNEKVVVGGATGEYSYVIHGTRKDVKKLKVDC